MKIYTIWTTTGEYYGLALSLTHAGKLIAAKTGIEPPSGNLAMAAAGSRNPQRGIRLFPHEHPEQEPITRETLTRVKAEGRKQIERRGKNG